MSILDFPTGLRPIASIVQNVVAAAAAKKADRDALIKAHAAAADFHNALDDAMTAEREIEDCAPNDYPGLSAYWQRQYQDAIGRAGVAMQKVPVKWLAIMNLDLPAELRAE